MLGFAGLLISALLVSGGVIVSGSDVNWGKKVPCFVIDETVVCPGCNQRAGLSCPSKLKESRNCLIPSTEATLKTTQEETTQRHATIPSETTTYEEMNATETTLLPSTSKYEETNEIVHQTPKETFSPYFYRSPVGLGIPRHRYARNAELLVQKEVDDEEGSCHWNGDCPCPLICCKTGPGCPKKCVKGIRLPPPWG